MCVKYCWIVVITFLGLVSLDTVTDVEGSILNMVDFRYWRCVMKREWKCPDGEINFYLYTSEKPYRQWVDMRHPELLEDMYGWSPHKKNVLIIHGFNGTYSKKPMTFIRDAYLHRKDFNVFMVDWAPLAKFPCYMSALSNMKLTSQCTAKLYSHLTQLGAIARRITCVGHSLGAHICGMISNHLTEKQYKIVGLDPARPLVTNYGSKEFRLGRDDAHVVQVIHTNAGFLGETGQVGHMDFCVNGGRRQPSCKGHFMRVARCSHFMSSCFFAASVRRSLRMIGVPCETSCPKEDKWGITYDRRAILMGEDAPDTSRGMYCVKINHNEDCPFD